MKFLDRLFGRQRPAGPPVPGLVLYHFSTCPYCLRTRAAAKRLGLHLALRNIHRSRDAFDELVGGGGKKQVPCLRITDPETGNHRWLYESDSIIQYLEDRYG